MVHSHSNTYTKMVHKTNRKIIVSVLWSGKVEPIKREIIYLPIENGGSGLLEPTFLAEHSKPLVQNQVFFYGFYSRKKMHMVWH